MQLVALRLRDLSKLFRARYGITLPDDDAGRDDMAVAVNHLAGLPHPREAIMHWLETWAPWLTISEQKDIIAEAVSTKRQVWKADALAWRLGLTAEDRKMLGITTIGAIDESKAERAKNRKEYQRTWKVNARRAAGAKPRKVYEAESITARAPWTSAGISRAKWYRQQAKLRQPETGSASA